MTQKLQNLQEMLFDALIEDLNDPMTRGPGLYAVVRGVLNDHKEDINLLPQETLQTLESAMSEAAPFQIKAS
jgi:hypothetical protein